MFDLANLFKSNTAQKDAIAKLLSTTPEALAAFESAYQSATSEELSENLFEINSRQASAIRQAQNQEDPLAETAKMVSRIVDELLAQTSVYSFDGNLNAAPVTNPTVKALPEGTALVSLDEIKTLPKKLRPQLTGTLMKKDIPGNSYEALLGNYQTYKTSKNPKKQKVAYDMFRAGLDILDLDPIIYEIIGMNPNSMGHWFPKLVDACHGQDFFKLPATTIAKVPLSLLQLTHCEYTELTQTTFDIVDQWAQKAFGLEFDKDYFIKTGTYSSKFDFRNARVHGEKEVKELGEYLLFIHYQALCMAHFTVNRPTYGVSTTNEWVVREFIQDKETNPCIYHGMPLHTEYRVFVDCDTDSIIGIAPYWEPSVMKKRFSANPNNVHDTHDYVIYKSFEDTLMDRYYKNKDRVLRNLENVLPKLDLRGQWSVDIMQNGDDFYIIDMALAENSAFYNEYVPENLRNPSEENWIPKLNEKKGD